MWHIRYAGFLKLIVIFLSQFSPEHNEHMFIFVFFPKSDERHKFELFYRRVTILRDGFQTDYYEKDVKMTSQLGLWIILVAAFN